MKKLIERNKTVIWFLLTFFGTYLLLAGAYQIYLTYGTSEIYYPDYITHWVARQSASLINGFGETARIIPHPNDPSMAMFVNGEYLVRIVEGCNAVSVMILFVAFVIAFRGKLKPTLLYILVGSVLLYTLNILRITLLCIGIYYWPDSREFLHGTLFPAFIYGVVFLLWIIWVNVVIKKKKKQR